MEELLRCGIYQHYKGREYEVLGVALHTETNEKMVVYQARYRCPDLEEEYGSNPLFVRPYKMFMEKVAIGGKKVPRFSYSGNVYNQAKQ